MPPERMGRDVDVQATLAAVRAALARVPEVRLGYVFGSAAEGRAEPGDLDIAVLLAAAPGGRAGGGAGLRSELDLRAAVEEAARGVPCDLVILNAAPLALAFEVLRTGKPIIEHDPEERIEFEAGIMSRMHDWRHYEARRDAWLLDRVRRRGLA